MTRLPIAILGLIALAPQAGASAFSTGYLFRRAITVANTVVPSTQINFPMLVSGTYSYLATVANGGQIHNTAVLNAQPVPADLIFTLDPSGSTLLKWEIAGYTAGAGSIEAWIQVPSLANGTVIYMFYGNTSATLYMGNAAGAWDANFAAVYHLGQNPNGSAPQLTDSTANRVNLTTGINGTGSLSTVPGQISSALYTNSSNEYNGSSASSSVTSGSGTGPWTLSGWFQFRSFNSYDGGANVLLGVTTSSSSRTLLITNSNTVIGQAAGLSTQVQTGATSALSTGVWYFFCLTYDGTTVTLFRNGVSAGTSPGPFGPQADGPISLGFGGRYNNAYNDEVRLSNTSRSAGWIATEYNNQSSVSTFYTIGPGTSMAAGGTVSAAVVM